ncbi:MAG: FAD-binding protein [Candidatus Electrothrix sp. AUS1_2]|nr:FAD-binding protein [Candidatus Electrothrix sp. AUS1_2]
MGTAKKTTVIVGAGLTGLSAAWKLASQGRNCLLAEQRSSPGGLAGSLVLDDIIFDLGPHFIFPDKHSPGGRLLGELLSEGEIISREFRYAIVTEKHHFKMPIKGNILIYPFKYKKQIITNILLGGKSPAPPRSLRSFIESKFGTAYYDEVFAGMVRKKTGRDGRELHVDWYIRPDRDWQNNRQRLPPSASKIKRILEPLKTFFSTNHYCYPKEGFGVLADRLLKRYQDAGGKILFNCNDIELVCSEDRIISCRLNETEVPVQEIIWTGTADKIQALLPDKQEDEKNELQQIDTLILLLTFNGKRLLPCPYSYTYHPAPNIIFSRAYSPENIFQEMSPVDREGLCLEINDFNWHGKRIKDMREEEILQHALDNVEQSGFFKKNSLRQSKLIRLKNSLPVYGLDYEEQLTARNRSREKFKNLYAVGRSGGAFFCMSPGAVSQGLKTAEHILSAKKYSCSDIK